MFFQSEVPSNTFLYLFSNISFFKHTFKTLFISELLGHTSDKNIGFLSSSKPRGFVIISSLKVPKIEYATTKGGEASQFAFTKGFTLPSKFLLPDNTEQTDKLFF